MDLVYSAISHARVTMMVMTRVSAPAYVRNVIDSANEFGESARRIFTPLLPQIYDELHQRVNEFVNDPSQCFDDDRSFPQRSVLDGHYYVGSELYEGDSADGPFGSGSWFVVFSGVAWSSRTAMVLITSDLKPLYTSMMVGKRSFLTLGLRPAVFEGIGLPALTAPIVAADLYHQSEFGAGESRSFRRRGGRPCAGKCFW
jgi:hypothetical protein